MQSTGQECWLLINSKNPTTGRGVLRLGGSLVIKVLESGATRTLAAALRPHFGKVTWVTPRATRRESREVFLVCLRRRAPAGGAPAAARAASAA